MKRELVPILEGYNKEDEQYYISTYSYLKGIADGCGYINMAKALPLARMFHDGQYRKGLTKIDGKDVHLPYLVHVLRVCSTLVDLHIPYTHDELDIMYATALLHDSVEDCDDFFPDGGYELVQKFGMSETVYEKVMLLSKYPKSDEFELNLYFNRIKKDKIGILIKLADRSNNVEDLYNKKIEKIFEYIDETKDYIYPMTSYAKQHYPELSNAVTQLKNKIRTNVEAQEVIISKYEAIIAEKNKEIEDLKKENRKLRREFRDIKNIRQGKPEKEPF